MIRPRAVVLFVAALAAGGGPVSRVAAGTVTALVRSGDVASDGLALETILRPAARSATDVAFVGNTSAILVRQGGATSVLAKTGDPLPAGQAGTFNAVYDPTIDDAGTRVAFAASLNGNAQGGIFLHEDGHLVTVRIGDASPAGVGLNGRGDIVFREGSFLSLMAHGSPDTVQIASLDDPVLGTTRRGRFLGRPALNDAGAVAFVVDNRRAPGGGVFFWSAATGTVPVGRAGDASPLAGRTFAFTRRQAAAINAVGQVAFTATLDPGGDTAVFAWDPGTGLTRTVAAAGTVIGSTAMTGADPEYVGIDASGRVAFQARLGSARRLIVADGATFTTLAPIGGDATDFRVGLTPATRVAWIRGGSVEGYDGERRVLLAPADVPLGPGFTLARPGLSDAGIVVAGASRGGLYRIADGALRPVVRDGETVGGIGAVASIVDGGVTHGFRGDALVILATDVEARRALMLERGAALTKIVASGDPSPVGGTFEPQSSAAVDVDRRRVVFSSSIVLADRSQRGGLFAFRLGGQPIRALVRPGATVAGGGVLVDVSLIGGTRKPVFRGTLADGRSGLFVLRGRRPAALARSGDGAPGGGVFGEVRTVAVDGDRVVFTALLGPGDDAPQGVFRWQRGRVQRIATTGDPSPGRGAFSAFGAVDVAGNRAVFGATILDAGQPRFGVFRGRPGRIEIVALAGDPLDGGATLALDGFGRVAVDGQTIGFVGGRSEATSDTRSALIEIRRGVVGVVAVAGQPTPLGGVYGQFSDEAVAPTDGAVAFAASIDGVAGAREALFTLAHERGR